MRRILLSAGAIALAVMTLGLAACDPEEVADIALPTVKAAAVNIAVGAAAGDTKAREIVLAVAGDGYCGIAEADRLALRDAFSIDGRSAFVVDCGVVATLRGKTAAVVPAVPPFVVAIAALQPPAPHRRE